MKRIQSITAAVAISVATMAASAWAANDEHDGHHPAVAAQPQSSDTNAAMAKAPAGMEAQMKIMQAMHEKMMVAKTPEEHNALMAEQMKLMQSGMSMINGMGNRAAMGRGTDTGAGSGMGMGTGTPSDMAARQGMIEQRMDMMQTMMQMMMDRMQAAPASK